MKKTVRFIVLLLCAALLVSCAPQTQSPSPAATTGGAAATPAKTAAKTEAETATPTATPDDHTPKATKPGEFPVYTGDQVTFSAFAQISSSITTMKYGENAFSTFISDLTGVRIEFDEVRASAQEKLNLVLASKDLPDIIFMENISADMQVSYGSQGIFLPLEELLVKNGYFFQKNVLTYLPNIFELYRMSDGKIYCVPKVQGAFEILYENMCLINQTWLDTLNLPMPSTTQELKDTLIAFKTRDPNGNGKADELGIVCLSDAVWGFMMFPFIYHDGFYSTLINRDGNDIFPAFTQDGFKEGLRYLNDLFVSGLLEPETFNITSNSQLRAITLQEEMIVGVIPAKSKHAALTAASERVFDYEYLPSLIGPDGSRRHMYNPDIERVGDNFYYVAITSACKYPDIAIRFFDAFYDEEITLRSMYGIKDEDWRYGTEGEIGINGKPAVWTSINQIWSVENSHGWQNIAPSFFPWDLRYGEKMDMENIDTVFNQQYAMYIGAKECYAPYAEEESHFYNNLLMLPEDIDEAVSLKNDIYSYVKEQVALFITGEKNLDTDWDNYLKTLDSYGLDRWMELQVEATQRQYGEKVTYRK